MKKNEKKHRELRDNEKNEAYSIVQNKRVARIETNINRTTMAWQWVNRALELWHFSSFFSLQSYCALWKSLRAMSKRTTWHTHTQREKQTYIDIKWQLIPWNWMHREIEKKNHHHHHKKHKAKTIKLTKIRLTENEASRKTKSKWHK